MSELFRFLIVCAALLLAGCEAPRTMPAGAGAKIGTRAIIQWHGQEVTADITEVNGRLVKTEFHHRGDLFRVRDYYRGLYPVAGRQQNSQFEIDFDEQKIEALFPLRVGDEASFTGNLKLINTGVSLDIWINISVLAEKTISLPDGDRKVYVVEIFEEPLDNTKGSRKVTTYYYAPDLAMNLKTVTKVRGSQSFWRVVSIEEPKGGTAPARERPRRSGTVMI